MSENTINLDRFEALIEAQEAGKEFELVDENGKPIGMKIGLVGPDSPRSQDAQRSVAEEFSKRAEDRAMAGEATPKDEGDQRMAAYLAKVATHWTPEPSFGGQAVPFTEENVRNFFVKFRIFREQMEARAVWRAPFAPSSSSGSAS